MRKAKALSWIFLIAGCCLQATCHASPENPLATNYTTDILRLAKAAHIKAFMHKQQLEQQPCNNFYKFACGNWQRLHSARVHNKKTNHLEELQELYVHKTVEILKGSTYGSDTSADRQLKYFYGSCRSQANDTKSQLAAMMKLVDFRGGWPDIRVGSWYQYEYDWLHVIATLKRHVGLDILIGMDVIPDYKERNIHRLKVGAPQLPLGGQRHYLDSQHMGTRELYVRNIAKKLRNYFPEQSEHWAEQVASQVLHIEQQLAKGLPHNAALTMEQTTRHRSVSDLKAAYGNFVDLNRYLNLIFNDTIYVEVYETPEDYLSNLVDIIRGTPKLQLANYTIWRLLDFLDGARVPQHIQTDIWCVQKVHEFFPHQLESIFHRNFNNMKMINDVQSTWADVKRVFRESLQASEKLHWLTLETRQRAISKLDALELKFRTHDDLQLIRQMHGLSLHANEFYPNLLNALQWRTQLRLSKLVTAPEVEDIVYQLPHYELTTNKIQIPITFLQARFFWDPVYPHALRYGTLGVLLARQMLHGFDDVGRRYDKHGYKNNWWDRISESSYSRRAQCFEEQYAVFVQYKDKLVRDDHLLQRVVADNGALNIAFRAYQQWFRNSEDTTATHQKEILPLLDYSQNQLFYLAYAQLWCTDYPDSLEIFNKLPEELRVNAALSNSQQFADAYNCARDAKLNSRHKCTIY